MEKEKIIIYGKLNSLNDYTKACRSNKFAGANMKKKNEDIVKAAVLCQIGFKKFKGKVKLNFKWIDPNQKRDLDNICFAKKFILDALVEMGTIESDSRKNVTGFVDTFDVDKNQPRIEVTIESEEEENE